MSNRDADPTPEQERSRPSSARSGGLHRPSNERQLGGESRLPADTVARRVTAPTPKHAEYEAPSRPSVVTLDAPLPTIEPPRIVEDLRGERRGLMVIVGYLGRKDHPKRGKSRHLWLGRCDCGKYEVRDAYKWRKGRGKDDRCDVCNWTQIQRWNAKRGGSQSV